MSAVAVLCSCKPVNRPNPRLESKKPRMSASSTQFTRLFTKAAIEHARPRDLHSEGGRLQASFEHLVRGGQDRPASSRQTESEPIRDEQQAPDRRQRAPTLANTPRRNQTPGGKVASCSHFLGHAPS